ncbi:MAG: DUF177 domain-containing protein [Candidatus Marinimicrobia bacterium]|nr:DUF177 domain-containing protein [Candidatus Neomarinimicrobiota bacterium]
MNYNKNLIKVSSTNKFLSIMKIELSSFDDKITKFEKTFQPESLGLEEEGLVNPIHLQAKIIKEETGRVWLAGEIKSKAKLKCDRCLENFNKEIKKEIRLLFDPKEEGNKQEQGTFIISEDTLDLTKYLRDSLLLGLPSKNLCSPDCKGLCEQCGANLNITTCQCGSDNIDPRLEKLKKIKSKMEE